MGSSKQMKFVIATVAIAIVVVGLLAILGALLCVGFLVVEPARKASGLEEKPTLAETPTPTLEGNCTSHDCAYTLCIVLLCCMMLDYTVYVRI